MITQAFCVAAKLDLLNGVHQPGDDYRIALYGADAELNEFTDRYTVTGEIVGAGYEAGGQSLTGQVTELAGSLALRTWNNPLWPNATIEAHGALIYNASRGDRAVEVLRFANAPVKSTNGVFTVPLPPHGAQAVLRIE